MPGKEIRIFILTNKNGKNLCSVPRSRYDRRVSTENKNRTKIADYKFSLQHQPPRTSCRCHQGQT